MFLFTGCSKFDEVVSDASSNQYSIQIDSEDIELEKYYPVELDVNEDSNYASWLSLLNEFELYANECNVTQFDKMNYIRGKKYNSVYWGELLAYDDENLYRQITSYKPEFEALREETIVCIPETNIHFKTVHMIASLQCMKDGIGSFGSWKGDLVELARDIETDETLITYDDKYQFAYNSMSSMNSSSCNIVDISSDIMAVNIGKNMTINENLTDAISYYATYIPYFNQYAVFIKNEFGVSDVTRETLRTYVKKGMNSDILVTYLMRSFELKDDGVLEIVNDAFADFLYDSLQGESVSNLTKGLEKFVNTEKQKQIEIEFKQAQLDKYKVLLKNYIYDTKLAELFDRLHE